MRSILIVLAVTALLLTGAIVMQLSAAPPTADRPTTRQPARTTATGETDNRSQSALPHRQKVPHNVSPPSTEARAAAAPSPSDDIAYGIYTTLDSDFESANEKFDSVFAALDASGPAETEFAHRALAAVEATSNRLREARDLYPGIHLGDTTCRAAGCAIEVNFGESSRNNDFLTALQVLRDEGVWDGRMALTSRRSMQTGGTQSLWLLISDPSHE